MAKCSFCDREIAGSVIGIGDESINICSVCVGKAATQMYNYYEKSGATPYQIYKTMHMKLGNPEFKTYTGNDEVQRDFAFRDKMTPKEIYERIGDYVISQNAAKKVLSVATRNHYKRLASQGKTEVVIEKSNVLLLGPTGSGKTFLIETLAKILDVPMVIADATSLTEAGYVGEDVENILTRLVKAADGDIEKAQRGIVYIDEIDKIAAQGENVSTTKDVGGQGVQQSLLKMIEGRVVEIQVEGGRRHPNAQTVEIDTKNILFIVGGAFASLDYSSIDKTNYIEKLKSFGMIPELLGRLPIFTTTEKLSVQELVNILVKPKNAIVKQYKAMYRMDNIDLDFTDAALEAIAKLSEDKNMGARGLRSTMEEVMLDLSFEAPSHNNLIGCLVDFKNNKITREFIYKENDKVAE